MGTSSEAYQMRCSLIVMMLQTHSINLNKLKKILAYCGIVGRCRCIKYKKKRSLNARAAGEPSTLQPPGKTEMNDREHILIVDDEKEICEVVRDYLTDEGYRVSIAL